MTTAQEAFEKLIREHNADNPSGHTFDLATCDMPYVYSDAVTAMCFGFYKQGQASRKDCMEMIAELKDAVQEYVDAKSAYDKRDGSNRLFDAMCFRYEWMQAALTKAEKFMGEV